MKKGKKTKHLVAGLLGLLLLCFTYHAVKIRYYSKNFFETKSDVALVLGAGTNNGKLSPVYQERVLHAIHLLKQHKVDRIIFTGGLGEGQSISDAQVAANFAVQQGIHPNKILTEEASTITFANVQNARKIMQSNGLETALLVSDPYHMKRSMDMCQLMEIAALPSPTPTTMYRSRKTKFNFLVKETINYWGYLLVGQHRDWK